MAARSGIFLIAARSIFLVMEQPPDHVGDLDAGIVDVVLHLDLVAQEAAAAGQDVAQAGVAQMADMGRLCSD